MKAEVIAINPNLQKNLDLLNAFKAQVDEIGDKCKQIEVKDSDSVAIATQNLSKANSMLKTIEDKVKLIRKPYNDELDKISDVGGALTKNLAEGVKTLKDKVAEYERLRQEKEANKQKILTYISVDLKKRLQELYEGCKTKEACKSALDYIKTKFPPDTKFGDFVKQAHDLRDQYIALIEAVEAGDMVTALQMEEIAAEATESIVELQQSVAVEGISSKTRGTRMIWDFELAADIKSLPAEWLTVDESKVKEYLAENKASLQDGQVIDGIKFYKKISISA